MGFRQWIFGRPQNQVTVLQTTNLQLCSLLAIEQKHSSDLLQQLKALQEALLNHEGNGLGNHCETVTRTQMPATKREQDVLDLLQNKDSISSSDVTATFNYSFRQVACSLLLRMTKKGIIAKTGTGKNTKYKLPE